MGFGFSSDQNFVSSSKAQLKGGEIHKVLFKEATFEVLEGKKDETRGQKYNVFKISFENDQGYYTEMIFEPRQEDYQRRETDFGGNKIEQPSRAEEIQLIVGQLVEAVNPGGMKKLEGKSIPDFKTLCDAITKLTAPGKDKEVELKLILDTKGRTRLPYLAGINKERKVYPRTNYVGKDLFFTDKEVTSLNKIKSAKPTDTAGLLAERADFYDNSSTDDTSLDLDL